MKSLAKPQKISTWLGINLLNSSNGKLGGLEPSGGRGPSVGPKVTLADLGINSQQFNYGELVGRLGLEPSTHSLNICVSCTSPCRSDYPIPRCLALRSLMPSKTTGVPIIVVEPSP